MTSEQLQATRALRWRQNGSAVLTLEDAQVWLQQAGLCLFLPRKAQLPAPAPSFVEACLGVANPTPPRAAIETARELLARLIDANLAVPLNLLGTGSDLPDFLVSPDTLPFVFALRGDRNWKHAPGEGANRVSPLVLQVWKLIERKGVLTAEEIKDALGKELTEAAALRALNELWTSMRVTPLYQPDGEPTLWEALQTRQTKALNAGTSMSQVTALSVLVSLYLETAVAATAEEAEIFLSPLSSRSKVREVVRGLTATRQLSMISMERETLLHVEGSLPEFGEPEAAADATAEAAPAANGDGPVALAQGFARPQSIKSAESMPPFAKSAFAKSAFAKATSGRPRPTTPPGVRSIKPIDADPRDGISTWPHRFTPEAAPDAAPGVTGEGKSASVKSQSGETAPPPIRAVGPRGPKFAARPPWKDKGKPGFAKSRAGMGEKARWPRQVGPDLGPRPVADGGDRPRPYPASRAAGTGSDFKPRREFKPGGEFKPRSTFKPAVARPNAFKPRSGGPAGAEFKRGADFGDFKPRKAGAFKPRPGVSGRPSSGVGFKAGGSKTGGFKPSGFKSAGFKSGGSRPPARPPTRQGEEFRQPWKQDAPSRRPGGFGSKSGAKSGEGTSARPAYTPRPSTGARIGFKKDSRPPFREKAGFGRPTGDARSSSSSSFPAKPWQKRTSASSGSAGPSSRPPFKSPSESSSRPSARPSGRPFASRSGSSSSYVRKSEGEGGGAPGRGSFNKLSTSPFGKGGFARKPGFAAKSDSRSNSKSDLKFSPKPGGFAKRASSASEGRPYPSTGRPPARPSGRPSDRPSSGPPGRASGFARPLATGAKQSGGRTGGFKPSRPASRPAARPSSGSRPSAPRERKPE